MNDSETKAGMGRWAAAALAIGGVTAAALIGQRTSPTPDHRRTRRWYKDLEKPDFTPPTPAYGIAWTVIQAALAYGGYRLLRAEPSPERTTALAAWAANQVGIGGWSAVFFGQRALGTGAIAAGGLATAAAGYVAAAARVDRSAAATGVPLVAWTAFATVLAEEIWRRNEPAAG